MGSRHQLPLGEGVACWVKGVEGKKEDRFLPARQGGVSEVSE